MVSEQRDIVSMDKMFEVIHTSGHSSNSVCFYCEDEGTLFLGDTPVVI